MARYALRIAYDGAGFCGWQRQAGQPSVQATLEAALRALDPAVPAIAAAGRTDTGVHAAAQVAHCDLSRDWAPARLRAALNHHLRPARVAVLAVAPVGAQFHARFSAIGRAYRYRILSRAAPPVAEAGQVWHLHRPLDLGAMQAGARALVGRHDFTTFRAAQCQAASPLKTLDSIEITAHPVAHGTEFHFALAARSFLHNQVRGIVGTLERVGAGAWPPGRVAEALAACERSACGPVAPPEGLCLSAVRYNPDPFAAPGAAI